MRILDRRRPLGRPRCRKDDNIKKDLSGLGWGNVAGSNESDNKPSGSMQCGSSLE